MPRAGARGFLLSDLESFVHVVRDFELLTVVGFTPETYHDISLFSCHLDRKNYP